MRGDGKKWFPDTGQAIQARASSLLKYLTAVLNNSLPKSRPTTASSPEPGGRIGREDRKGQRQGIQGSSLRPALQQHRGGQVVCVSQHMLWCMLSASGGSQNGGSGQCVKGAWLLPEKPGASWCLLQGQAEAGV